MSGPLITGVGSLPHRDAGEAAEFVLATTTLPYLPQLPNRHPEERMLVQWGDGLCGCGADEESGVGLRRGAPEGPRRLAFGGARALLARLDGTSTGVKTQATGPVTLALGLLSAGHPGEGLWDCVVDGLTRRVEDHVREIRASLPDATVTLIFDEPGLSGLLVPGFPISAADAEAVLRSVLGAAPVPAGVHCCADTDWSLVARVRPAWISWDVGTLGAAFDQHAEALAAVTWEGTRFIWGVVPTQAGPPPGGLPQRLQRVVGKLVTSGARLAGLVEDSMFSPACGLAGLTEDQAAAVAGAVAELAWELTSHG